MSSNKVINIVLNESAVIEELSKLVEKLANDAIKRDDVFKVGLSGGSLANFLSKGLPNITTEWSKWKLFFCDERVVPLDSTDSTFGVYKNSLIGAVPLSENQFIKINPQLPAEEAARDYIQKMAVHFPPDELPRFHLLLLGMGPDGHTCSLFPGHRLLEETSVWVAPITDSPKPPPYPEGQKAAAGRQGGPYQGPSDLDIGPTCSLSPLVATHTHTHNCLQCFKT